MFVWKHPLVLGLRVLKATGKKKGMQVTKLLHGKTPTETFSS